MEIDYKVNEPISAEQFITLLKKTSLGVRRPIDNIEKIQAMLDNSNLIVTAWGDGELIGIARSVTDFNFCCYLSDLAVDESIQSMGVGKYLILVTKEEVSSEGSDCICPDLNFPDGDISIPFSLQYLIPLWKTNYLESGLGYAYQFGSTKRNESNTNVFYGSVGFRRHFGRKKGWMWKVNFTPVLSISNAENSNRGLSPWGGISLGKRF